jgi:hypothetical protein
VNAFIDAHRVRCGVEPICSALQIAPSAYRRHAARQRDPALLPARAQRDASLMPQVQRVFDANLRVYGADKVWQGGAQDLSRRARGHVQGTLGHGHGNAMVGNHHFARFGHGVGTGRHEAA